MRRGLIPTFLLIAWVSAHAQSPRPAGSSAAAKTTADLSGVWMPNVNYTTLWEPYDGAWTKETFAQYDQNVPRPRMARGQPAAAASSSPRAATIPMTPWAEAI